MARFQLDISDKRLKEIEALMELTNPATKKEFVNSAITLLKWSIRQRQLGCSIASYNDSTDHIKELAMPILDDVQPVEKLKQSDTG